MSDVLELLRQKDLSIFASNIEPVGYVTNPGHGGHPLVSDDGKMLIRSPGVASGASLPGDEERWRADGLWAIYNSARPRSLSFLTTAQGKASKPTLFPPLDEAQPFGSVNGYDIFAFTERGSLGSIGNLAGKREFASGVGRIVVNVASPEKNVGFLLPRDGARYRVLEARLKAETARLLLLRYFGGRFVKGTLQYYQMSRGSLSRVPRSRLTAAERMLDGSVLNAIIPSSAGPSWTVPPRRECAPTSADTERGVVIYEQGYRYFNAHSRRMERLPIKLTEKVWRVDVIAGRICYWLEWAPTERAPGELYAETKPGKWEPVGQYEVLGKSANGKYAVIRKPDHGVALGTGDFYVVQPKPLR